MFLLIILNLDLKGYGSLVCLQDVCEWRESQEN